MFNKIIVAYDGSETSKIALDKAIEMKRLFVDSELEVVHVFQVSNLVLNDAVITGPPVVQTELYQAANELVDEAKLRISNLDKTSATLLDGGAPARVILDYAEANHADLIIVGVTEGLALLKKSCSEVSARKFSIMRKYRCWLLSRRAPISNRYKLKKPEALSMEKTSFCISVKLYLITLPALTSLNRFLCMYAAKFHPKHSQPLIHPV